MQTLKVEHRDDRVIVELNRPETLNSIDQTMASELHAVCDQLEQEPAILIIIGAETDKGRIFASGADISQLLVRERGDTLRGMNAKVFDRIKNLPLPVIAALDGVAFGGGAELAYAADFRIATDRVKIGNPEPKLGIIAAAGATWRLVELIGEAAAKEVLLAGRVLNATEAQTLGLVSEICAPSDLLERANDLADRIAKFDPFAIQLTKLVMHSPRSAHPTIDNIAQSLIFESPRRSELMRDFLNRRKER